MNWRRDLVAAACPSRPRSSYGAYWPKTLSRWWPSGRGRRVVAGLDVDLAEADGGLAAVARLERALGGVEACVTSIVARAGQSAPGAAVHSGSAVSAALNLTTGLRTFHASSRAR